MKPLLLTTVACVFLASSASAGGFSFSLPYLWFPDQTDTTVTRDAPSGDATSVSPIVKE